MAAIEQRGRAQGATGLPSKQHDAGTPISLDTKKEGRGGNISERIPLIMQTMCVLSHSGSFSVSELCKITVSQL